VRLGETSYALYLIHFPLLRLAYEKYPDASSGLGLLLLLAQFMLASHLLWQCVESPARRPLTRLFPPSEGRSNLPLFPASERKTLLLTVLAHTAVIVTLFAFQKYLETS
jgi:peptidoglycan/LPS O-acetylase OafA/YrhL